MPLYEVRHITPLTPAQQSTLAQRLTTLHSTKFTTPRLFVNVLFTPAHHTATFVGGKPRKGNQIIANVRSGPTRTAQDWEELSREVVRIWEEVVGSKGELELRTFFVVGGLEGGWEAGFMIPRAGGDVEWLRENMDGFKKKAAEGDEEFEELVKEIGERGLLNGGEKGKVNGH